MKNIYSSLAVLFLLIVALAFADCSSDDESGVNTSQQHDVLQINADQLACYGYRSAVTYSSSWNSQKHKGEIVLPCGKLANAENGEHNYEYLYTIYLEGETDLNKGSKLENFYPTFEDTENWSNIEYVSGSAIVTDKKDNQYITIKFDSFKFDDGNETYVLNGTIQLDLDEE